MLNRWPFFIRIISGRIVRCEIVRRLECYDFLGITLRTYFTPCSSVSIVNFVQVNAGWERSINFPLSFENTAREGRENTMPPLLLVLNNMRGFAGFGTICTI